MAKLNCRVGDLAMIVRYELPADLGCDRSDTRGE